jgi:hypothetical protein
MNTSLADYLESHVDGLATEVTQRMEDQQPDLFRRYRTREGARDPAEWCKEDTAYHLRHLAAAVDSGDPDEFREYRSWLVGMLGARGIPETDIDGNLEAIDAVLTARLGEDAAPAVAMLSIR